MQYAFIRFTSPAFYGQKPSAFDPLTGSVTVPCYPRSSEDSLGTFQFCVRDKTTAREDLAKSIASIKSAYQRIVQEDSSLDLLLFLGSMERGSKLFRQQNWESSQLSQALLTDGKKPPLIGGLYTSGVFTNSLSSQTTAVM